MLSTADNITQLVKHIMDKDVVRSKVATDHGCYRYNCLMR